MSNSDAGAVASTEGLGLEAANRLELLAHSGGLRGPADAWTMLRSGIATEIAAAVAAERERHMTDTQIAEFAALCVMNRRSKRTARELLAEFKAERGIGA